MNIIRGVYEGLTAVIYGLVLDVILKALLLMGFTDLVNDALQLIVATLWIGIEMFGWNGVCIVNRGVCRLSTIYRYLIFIAVPLLAFSYLLYMYGSDTAAAVLFLVTVSTVLGLSVASYIGAYMVVNQFRSNVGKAGVLVSIIAVIMWLTLISGAMEIGTAINALGNTLILIALLQVRRRYTPMTKFRHR
ncbi:hypothetical protein [Vulcanisaeta sp. JCM 16159]|uniref:hypothetical protein n=1 Tax=Vulcanisaeta sp. JCM 16159 TaxID=1295371 RepID=UPI0006D21EC0|nr:hypothetical protein [Vulcanisaeta sp. JCM 16159]